MIGFMCFLIGFAIAIGIVFYILCMDIFKEFVLEKRKSRRNK